MSTTGVESKNAEPIAVIRFVAPGPLVAKATPGVPEILPWPSAAKPAACSCFVFTI